jgi:hypothetical protein
MDSLTRNPKIHQVIKLGTSWIRIVMINLLLFFLLLTFGELVLRLPTRCDNRPVFSTI